MAILNRILSVLIVLLAITAAVFSFLLFERRQEFRERADKLADTLSQTVQQIDRNSQTSYSEKLTFNPATEERPSSGTLSWQKYHEAFDPETKSYAKFDDRIKTAVEAASSINEQRDLLAEKFAEAGIILGLDESDAQAADLKNLDRPKRYQTTSETIVDQADAVIERDTQMIQSLAEISNRIGHPIDRAPFEKRDRSIADEQEGTIQVEPYNVESELSELESNVSNLKDRCDEYADTLSDTLFNRIDLFSWTANKQDISSETETEYTEGLRSLVEDFGGINQKLRELEITKQDLEETKTDLAETEQELRHTKETIIEQENENADLKDQIARLKDQKGIDDDDTPIVEMEKDLRGEVLEVNRQWGFVVTDLGRGEINSGTELLVAQNDDFVARIMVTRVLQDVSVAEISPEVQSGTISIGDRLILPQEETN
ncbi:MAG: hypothetical protein ACOCWJ_00915 [Verrucomicrobiota bacterium]